MWKWCCAHLPWVYVCKLHDESQQHRACLETRLLNNALALYCLLNQLTQMDKDCDTYNEYICIYGPEIGGYCLSSNSDVGLIENVAENIQ